MAYKLRKTTTALSRLHETNRSNSPAVFYSALLYKTIEPTAQVSCAISVSQKVFRSLNRPILDDAADRRSDVE